MTPALAVLGGLLGFVLVLLRDTIKDMCRGEAQARLSQLPQALLWLAVRQVPRELRDDFGGEWRSELDAIRREKSDTPLTGLVYGLFFVAGLLIRARAIAREYTGRPHALATARDAIRRLATREIAFILRNRTTRPSTGDFALAAPAGSGSGTISIRRPVAITAGLALATGAALTVYATIRPGPVAGPPQGTIALSNLMGEEAAAAFTHRPADAIRLYVSTAFVKDEGCWTPSQSQTWYGRDQILQRYQQLPGFSWLRHSDAEVSLRDSTPSR